MSAGESFAERAAREGVAGLVLLAVPASSRNPGGVAKVRVAPGVFAGQAKRSQIARERRNGPGRGHDTRQAGNVDEG